MFIAMGQHSVVLRAAKPTFDEGLACGRYLDEAAEGFYTFMLGRRAAQLLATAYVQPNHSYSFQNVTFAERDRRIVGMVLGFTAEQRLRFSDRPLKETAGYPALRVTAVRTLLAPLFRILENIGDDDFYVLAIAIDEEARRKGVGSALMDSAEERARASHAARLSLDVSAKNGGAYRLYERRGMTVESQWPKRLPMPGLKFYRMTKAL
jgi:ribosomal protein S18 acetylase RimI-like enzyme